MSNPIPVLGIPIYNRADLTMRCLRSIDYPVDNLVLVVQGPPNETADLLCALRVAYPNSQVPNCRKTTIITHPNAGVSGAWNEILWLWPSRWTMLVNNDIEFAKGDLQRMCEAADADPDAGCFYSNHGASFWIVTKRAVETLNGFDINLWPAYLEDCCFAFRCDLAGLRRVNVPGCASLHGEVLNGAVHGSRTINSDPRLAHNNGLTHAGNFEYYVRKYGGINGEEKFKYPFNDPNWPLGYWKFEPETRARQMAKWNN